MSTANSFICIHSPNLCKTRDEVVRPRGEDVLLHRVDDLLVVAEEHGGPRAGVQPENVAILLLVIVQDLHRLAAKDVHVADQREAGSINLSKKFLNVFDNIQCNPHSLTRTYVCHVQGDQLFADLGWVDLYLAFSIILLGQ